MITPSSSVPGKSAGFTLIELMVTIVIGTILLTIAIPSYMSEIRKSRRTDARNAVLDAATREERYLSTANVYTQVPANLGYAGAFPQTVGSGYYTLGVQAGTAANGTATYLITATATGSQVKDTACASFSVNQIGQQTALTSGAVDSTTTCWGN
jgi:type IV pilus assembly protein PilE